MVRALKELGGLNITSYCISKMKEWTKFRKLGHINRTNWVKWLIYFYVLVTSDQFSCPFFKTIF